MRKPIQVYRKSGKIVRAEMENNNNKLQQQQQENVSARQLYHAKYA